MKRIINEQLSEDLLHAHQARAWVCYDSGVLEIVLSPRRSCGERSEVLHEEKANDANRKATRNR
jgi:hypothetical protein